MAQLQVKKMKQGMSYSCKEKTIILNVFKYFRNQFPDKCVTDIVRRTSKATGCSEKSIFQFRKEEASVEGFREPSKTKVRKNININSRDIKYDSTVRQAIRNIIYNLKYNDIIPSLNTILKQVNSDEGLPNFSLMTLRRLMFDMGFYYEKNGNKSILTEKQNVGKTAPQKDQDMKPMSTTHSHNSPKLIETVIVPPPNSEVPHNLHSFVNHPPVDRVMPMPVTLHHNPTVMPPSHAPTYHNMPMMMNNHTDYVPTHSAVEGRYIKMELPAWMVKQQAY